MTPAPIQQLPGLADFAAFEPDSFPDLRFMSPAEATWFCMIAVLPIGWTLATPVRLEPEGPWVAIAYNVAAGLYDVSHLAGTGSDPQAAVIRVASAIAEFQDAGLLRDRAHRPN